MYVYIYTYMDATYQAWDTSALWITFWAPPSDTKHKTPI